MTRQTKYAKVDPTKPLDPAAVKKAKRMGQKKGTKQRRVGRAARVIKGGSTSIYSEELIAKAIIRTGGHLSDAARMIGCARSTLQKRLEKSSYLRNTLRDVQESRLDDYERKADEIAMSGDRNMLMFMLKTIGKDRGYVERQETLNQNLDIQLVWEDAPPVEDATIIEETKTPDTVEPSQEITPAE